jgi:hypothetical protein
MRLEPTSAVVEEDGDRLRAVVRRHEVGLPVAVDVRDRDSRRAVARDDGRLAGKREWRARDRRCGTRRDGEGAGDDENGKPISLISIETTNRPVR